MRKILAALAVLTALAAPAAAQTNPLVVEAQAIVEDMTAMTSRPIAVLTRSDNDPAEFWYLAAQALCDATGDNWCEDEVMFLSDTTNQLGWARVFTYRNKEGVEKTACALLPPRPGIHPGFAATGISGGTVIPFHQLPTSAEMEAWLWYLHIASCQNDSGSTAENTRAAVFATMTLTLVQGDTNFVGAYNVSPSRRFNQMLYPTQTRWATNVGERVLLEHWKKQAATALTAKGCNAVAVPASDLNTDYISRDAALGSANNCYDDDADTGYMGGQVTDANLWLWTQPGNPLGITAPPAPHVPFGMFISRQAAMTYVWNTSKQLAQ